MLPIPRLSVAADHSVKCQAAGLIVLYVINHPLRNDFVVSCMVYQRKYASCKGPAGSATRRSSPREHVNGNQSYRMYAKGDYWWHQFLEISFKLHHCSLLDLI